MNNNYLVAVLADRIQAESAYTMLEKQGVPLAKITILGRGYKTADEFGLIDPNETDGIVVDTLWFSGWCRV
jgi:hypothetical protein